MIVPGAYIVTNNYNTKAAHREEINSDLGNWTLNGKHRVKLVGISTHQTRLKGTPKQRRKARGKTRRTDRPGGRVLPRTGRGQGGGRVRLQVRGPEDAEWGTRLKRSWGQSSYIPTSLAFILQETSHQRFL